MRTLLMLPLFVGFVSVASAGESVFSSTVEFVYPLSDGTFVVGFTQSPPTCADTNNPKYLNVAVGHNGVTAEGLRGLLAAALVALTAEKPMVVAFENGGTPCYINRMVLMKQ